MKKNISILLAVGMLAAGMHNMLGQGSTPTPTPPAFRGTLVEAPRGGRLPGRLYVTGSGTAVATVTGTTGMGISLSGTAPVFTKLTDTNGLFNY